jgi:hypothetical protein
MGHTPSTQRTITVVMAAWCQCGVLWLNIMSKFGPRRGVSATVRDVGDGFTHRTIRLLSGGGIFYSTLVCIIRWIGHYCSKDNSSRCCCTQGRTFARALATLAQGQVVAFVNLRVGMATRSTVVNSAQWHQLSEKFRVAQ